VEDAATLAVIEAARRGEAYAFRELVERYQHRAYAVALAVLHDSDEARDVCQEAFLRVYKNLPTFDRGSQFFTWLFRIVRNLSIDRLRQRRNWVEFEDETAEAETEPDATGISPQRLGFDPARALADKELRRRINDALAKLSPKHRAVLVMREVEGLSYQEMADEMECSIGTIMSRLFHARKKMQGLLLELRQAAEPAA
jgi:RNA polymerase sigma-70 factor (ECF subfamily)